MRLKSILTVMNGIIYLIEEYTNCHEGLLMCDVEEYITVLNYVNM